VQKLVEDQVAELSASGHSAALTPVDACAALDPMHELHVAVHLVKIQVRAWRGELCRPRERAWSSAVCESERELT
jgi:hypothetical protein